MAIKNASGKVVGACGKPNATDHNVFSGYNKRPHAKLGVFLRKIYLKRRCFGVHAGISDGYAQQ